MTAWEIIQNLEKDYPGSSAPLLQLFNRMATLRDALGVARQRRDLSTLWPEERAEFQRQAARAAVLLAQGEKVARKIMQTGADIDALAAAQSIADDMLKVIEYLFRSGLQLIPYASAGVPGTNDRASNIASSGAPPDPHNTGQSRYSGSGGQLGLIPGNDLAAHGGQFGFNLGGMRAGGAGGSGSLGSGGSHGPGGTGGGQGVGSGGYGTGYGGGNGANAFGSQSHDAAPGSGAGGAVGGAIGGSVGGDGGAGSTTNTPYQGIGGSGSTDPADTNYSDLFSADNTGDPQGSSLSPYQGIGGQGSTDPANSNYSDLFPQQGDTGSAGTRGDNPKSDGPGPGGDAPVAPDDEPAPQGPLPVSDPGDDDESPRMRGLPRYVRRGSNKFTGKGAVPGQTSLIYRLLALSSAGLADDGWGGVNPRFFGDPAADRSTSRAGRVADPDDVGSQRPSPGAGDTSNIGAPGIPTGGDTGTLAPQTYGSIADAGAPDAGNIDLRIPSGPDPDNEWGAGGYNPHYEPSGGYVWTPYSRGGGVGATRTAPALPATRVQRVAAVRFK